MTKKEILTKTALRMMHDLGYQSMTMRLLADEMEWDVSSLYNHISSKQELLVQSLREISSMFLERMQSISCSNGTFEVKLRQMIVLYIHLSATRPHQVALLVNEWRNLEDEEQRAFLEEKWQVKQYAKDILLEGIKANACPKENIEWSLAYLLSSVRWVFTLFTKKGASINPIELENHLFHLITSGIRPQS